MREITYRLKTQELRIAISSKSGTGNTTVSTMLAERLSLPIINYTFRQLAEEKNMTLAEVIENAKNDDFYDKCVDSRQVELAEKKSCVLASRLAIWMLKKADCKIYLEASSEVRAKRIFNREGGDFQEIKSFTEMRDAEDSRRYKKLYGIDNSAYKTVADFVVDANEMSASEIVDFILAELVKRNFIEARLGENEKTF